MSLNKIENGIFENPLDPTIEIDEHGIGSFYFNKMKQYSNNVGQIDTETGVRETYGEMLQKCIRIALQMQAIGIKSDDIVSLCAYNKMDISLPILASIFLGNCVSNLDPSLSLSDMISLLTIIKPRIIFCVTECLDCLETALRKINMKPILVLFDVEQHENYISFNSFLEKHKESKEKNFQPKIISNIFDTAFIFFTSGTTGFQKGVCVTHYAFMYSSGILDKFFYADVSLNYSSPYWISYMYLFTMTIIKGGTRVICKEFSPENLFKFLELYKITYLFLLPAAAFSVNCYYNDKQYNFPSLKTVMIGGSLITKEQIVKLRKLFRDTLIVNVYGQSELTGCITALNTHTDAKLINEKTMTSGRLIPGMTAKVIDPETKEILGPNKRGELFVKSKLAAIGYYNSPEETKKLFDEDGFVRTGDIVYYDEDQCFFVVDRVKEVLKYRNWQVLPAELENIMLQHPAVKEAVIIGIPDEEDGDHLMAIIVLNDGNKVAENDLINFFNGQVIDRKRLRGGLKIVDKIPKTCTGKYSRQKLRDNIIAEKK